MGRIEDAAEALRQKQAQAESESERRLREGEEDLAEFVQLMQSKGIPPERTYRRSVDSRGIHSRESRPTFIISFDESPVTGWIVRFTFRGEYDDHEWFATLVTSDLKLWKTRAFALDAPTGRPVEYPSLQPGQLVVSKAFPGGARSRLVVTVDEPLPDHVRHIELHELPTMARTYLDSVS